MADNCLRSVLHGNGFVVMPRARLLCCLLACALPLLAPAPCPGQTHSVGSSGWRSDGTLNEDTPVLRFRAFNNREIPAKVYQVHLYANTKYKLTMDSTEMDSVLVIQDKDGQQLAFDDDSGGNLNALINFTPPRTATYKVYAGCLSGQGRFTLKVAEVTGDSGFGAPTPAAGKSQGPEAEENFRRRAMELFKIQDRNGDGFLNKDEMSPGLRNNLATFDKNGDGLIDFEEYLEYKRPHLLPGSTRPGQKPADPASSTAGSASPSSPEVIVIDYDELERRPNVYRAGKLPPGLPDWFHKLDTDRDGQVALWEWRKAGRSLQDFQLWDRNDDGFITAEEVLFKLERDQRRQSRPSRN
jgi:hypothetical protein